MSEIVEVLERPVEVTSTGSSGVLESSLATTLSPAWQGYLAETLSALETFSTERLDSLYNDACALYPIDIVTEKLMIPVLEQLGMRWDKRPSGIAEEHFFSAWLRNKLGARFHHGAGLARGRSLILACLPGEHHEISLLLAALGILQKGYRAVYLGADMPTGQLVPVYRQTHAAGVILAGQEMIDSARIEAVLIGIADLVENVDIPVFVGGRFSVVLQRELEQIGAQPVGENISLGLRLIEAGLSIAQNPVSRLRKR